MAATARQQVAIRRDEKFPTEWAAYSEHDLEDEPAEDHANTADTPRGLASLRAELVCALQQTLDRLELAPSAESMDAVDLLKRLTFRNISLLMERMASLEHVLQAIRDESGKCINCNVEIPITRLEVVGWPSCCITCEALNRWDEEPGKKPEGNPCVYCKQGGDAPWPPGFQGCKPSCKARG